MTNVAVLHIGGDQLCNPEAEAALLGALMQDGGTITRVARLLSPDDFSEPVHARIYAAVLRNYAASGSASPILLRPEFENDEGLKELGGLSYLMGLASDMSGFLALDAIAEQVADLARRRTMREALSSAARECSNPSRTIGDIAELVTQTTAKARETDISGTFELLDAAAIEALEPPTWLVHNLVTDSGLTFLYGEPGAGKSFIAIDMALRVATGMDWHGSATRKTGVLYIAAEGARGIGKRITGWRMLHRIAAIDAPFWVLPEAVQLLESGDTGKLLRTITEAIRRCRFPIGLVVIDTVSRTLVGADENTQETMTRFIAACDAIKRHTGGAVIGVHHSGKDKERGMRGSSVLLGACDAAIRCDQSDGLVSLHCEKQKDAEQPPPIYMRMEHVAWDTGSADERGEELDTLVPVRAETPRSASLSMDQIRQAFGIMADAWAAGKPLSNKPQTRRDGRYAPQIFARKLDGDAGTWEHHIELWLENGNLEFEIYDTHSKKMGLRVVDAIT